MKHVAVISRGATPEPGTTTLVETIILLLVGVYFRNWDNFISVIRNLEKFYAKT